MLWTLNYYFHVINVKHNNSNIWIRIIRTCSLDYWSIIWKLPDSLRISPQWFSTCFDFKYFSFETWWKRSATAMVIWIWRTKIRIVYAINYHWITAKPVRIDRERHSEWVLRWRQIGIGEKHRKHIVFSYRD